MDIFIIKLQPNFNRTALTQTVKCDFNGDWDYSPVACIPLNCIQVSVCYIVQLVGHIGQFNNVNMLLLI